MLGGVARTMMGFTQIIEAKGAIRQRIVPASTSTIFRVWRVKGTSERSGFLRSPGAARLPEILGRAPSVFVRGYACLTTAMRASTGGLEGGAREIGYIRRG